MTCQAIQAALADYSMTALPPDMQAIVRDHLRMCSVCRAEWREWRTLLLVLDATPSHAPPHDLWPEIAAQLRPRRAPSPWHGWLAAWRRPRKVFALASVSALVVLTLLVATRGPRHVTLRTAAVPEAASSFVHGHMLASSRGLSDPIVRGLFALSVEEANERR